MTTIKVMHPFERSTRVELEVAQQKVEHHLRLAERGRYTKRNAKAAEAWQRNINSALNAAAMNEQAREQQRAAESMATLEAEVKEASERRRRKVWLASAHWHQLGITLAQAEVDKTGDNVVALSLRSEVFNKELAEARRVDPHQYDGHWALAEKLFWRAFNSGVDAALDLYA